MVVSAQTNSSEWFGRSAGEEAGFAQDLEAVADAAEHRSALCGEAADGLHRRREARDRSAAEVVTVREATRQDDPADIAREVGVSVPEEHRLSTERVERPGRVTVVVRPRKDDDGDSWSGLGHASASTAIS